VAEPGELMADMEKCKEKRTDNYWNVNAFPNMLSITKFVLIAEFPVLTGSSPFPFRKFTMLWIR